MFNAIYYDNGCDSKAHMSAIATTTTTTTLMHKAYQIFITVASLKHAYAAACPVHLST